MEKQGSSLCCHRGPQDKVLVGRWASSISVTAPWLGQVRARESTAAHPCPVLTTAPAPVPDLPSCRKWIWWWQFWTPKPRPAATWQSRLQGQQACQECHPRAGSCLGRWCSRRAARTPGPRSHWRAQRWARWCSCGCRGWGRQWWQWWLLSQWPPALGISQAGWFSASCTRQCCSGWRGSPRGPQRHRAGWRGRAQPCTRGCGTPHRTGLVGCFQKDWWTSVWRQPPEQQKMTSRGFSEESSSWPKTKRRP